LETLFGNYVRPSPTNCAPDEPYKMSLGGTALAGAAVYFVIWLVALAGSSIYEKRLARKIKTFTGRFAPDPYWKGNVPDAPESGEDTAGKGHAEPESHPPAVPETRSGQRWILVGAIAAGALAGWLYALISRIKDCWSPRWR